MARGKSERIDVKLVEYSNKSRKGMYIHIHQKGKPIRDYKYHGETGEIDATVNYYRDRYVYKRPWTKSQSSYVKEYARAVRKDKPVKVSPISRQADRYLRKIRKQKPIEESINKGIASVTITKAHRRPPSDVRFSIMKLLGQLVLDKGLIELLSQGENLEKIKHRFEYTLKVQNEKSETVYTMVKFNENPNKVMTQIRQSTTEGESLSSEEYGTNADGGHGSNTKSKLKNF